VAGTPNLIVLACVAALRWAYLSRTATDVVVAKWGKELQALTQEQMALPVDEKEAAGALERAAGHMGGFMGRRIWVCEVKLRFMKGLLLRKPLPPDPALGRLPPRHGGAC
jgi:hypothetical protein